MIVIEYVSYDMAKNPYLIHLAGKCAVIYGWYQGHPTTIKGRLEF